MDNTETIDWGGCCRLLMKTIIGNTIPISWLFGFQLLLNVRWDGTEFWSAYAIASLFATFAMWYANRKKPDPTYHCANEVPSPIFGLVASTFQPSIFMIIFVLYTSVT